MEKVGLIVRLVNLVGVSLQRVAVRDHIQPVGLLGLNATQQRIKRKVLHVSLGRRVLNDEA
jgi:hypothetical protein